MLSVVVPVYNEAEVIEETFEQLKKVLEGTGKEFEIIAVDDASSDGSGEKLQKISDITVIRNRENHGYGASLKRGFQAAKGERILIIDADGTYPIEKIPVLIEEGEGYHMVVGARETQNDNSIRVFAKSILRIFAYILTSRWIPDLNSGMRIFDRELAMRFRHLFPSRFSLTTTITLAALTTDYDVKFVQIPYHKRVGKSSIKPWAFFQFMALLFRIVMYFDPLKFFLIPGIAVFLAGVGYGGYQIHKDAGLGELPVILLVGGFQMCFLGLLADLVVKCRGRD
jgi:glycosyltransferase involved in cell wall biosynthesis